ncbi:MAG: hypothetical protein IT377_18430 [Polyangiaceae bacterium]|nr:hypothetical protein [Polyangiaceae bacterium]
MRIVLWAGLLAGACGGAPLPPEPASDPPVPARRRADLPDDCASVPGKPPPEPLKKQYTGVASKARCQREVYTIMGGVKHFLGVECSFCHDERDYSKMTHRKHVANWMARELIPALEKKQGGELWCNDCHQGGGKGTAKILGQPRDSRWAAEWMTTHLVEDLQAKGGGLLRCKACHQGNPGTAEFQKKIILTDRLPRPLAKPEAAPPVPEPPPADAGPAP